MLKMRRGFIISGSPLSQIAHRIFLNAWNPLYITWGLFYVIGNPLYIT